MDAAIVWLVTLCYLSLVFWRSRILWKIYEDRYSCGPQYKEIFGKHSDEAEFDLVLLIRTGYKVFLVYNFLRTQTVSHYAIAAGFVVFSMGFVLCLAGRKRLGAAWADMRSLPYTKRDLVVSGVYRYSRNPIYVGLFLMWVGFLATFGWGLYGDFLHLVFALGLTLWTAVHYHHVILDEEESLRARYGDSYQHYLKLVPRYASIQQIFKT